MTNELKQIILEKYLKWIRDNTFLKDLKDDTIKIISPFLDARNDYIRLYVKKINEQLILTDGGYLVSDLESYGITLTEKRKELFEFIIQSYGLNLNPKTQEVYNISNLENIGRDKHRIIQCLVTLNDFFNYTEQNVKELFFYDVYDYLLKSKVSFTPNFNLRGKTGYEHQFDFGIGITEQREEILIKLVATPKHKQQAENCLFAFLDLERTNRKFRGIIIYRGSKEEANVSFIEAFKNYNYDTYSWEEKEEIIKVLIK